MKQIITATIAVMLICLVAIPIIDDSRSNVYYDENNTTGSFSTINNISSPDASITIEIISQSSTGTAVKINGNDYTIGNNGTYESYNVFSDTFSLMLQTSFGGLVEIPNGGRTTIATGGVFSASGGTWTYTQPSKDPISGTYKYIVYTDKSGDYNAYYNGNTIYATKGADYFAINWYNSANGGMFAHGKIDGEYTIDAKYTYSSETSTEYPYDVELEITTSAIDNNDLSLKIDSFKKIVTNESGDKTAYDVLIIVPNKYLAITENNVIMLSLIDLIPVLLISALMIGIGYSIMRRD